MSTPAASGARPFNSVGVVGCGLIGGSLALAAAAAGVSEVAVTDRDPRVLAAARERGVGAVLERVEQVAASAELVVLAVPVADIPAAARQVLPAVAPGTIVTDVGSVKARVLREVEGYLADLRASEGVDVEFIGGHPMAGSERAGLAGAQPTLFQGATYVLTPSRSASAEAFHRLAAFLRLVGARVLAVDADTHDRLVGVVSHLPQAIASALMAFAATTARDDPGLLTMAGGGFRDATRVAASDPDLWTGILEENRSAVLDAIDGFDAALRRLRSALAAGDRKVVRATLAQGLAGRMLLPGKVVRETLVDLVIPVADRPGSLADVTTALGAEGINIEDVSMRHAEEGDRGALVIAVGAGAAELARDVLAARGFRSHLQTR
ncbi:MAG TPA: prephenate dehydrogenase/arogenate dehydrogenase family protein [Nitriliruptorales bacterium]|nr:prephenate dehydrogenase/arogenate dehydrogenase family protein [Nitriliruptorales bacterium]